MKAAVDNARCRGYRQCLAEAAELFDRQGDATVVLADPIPPDLEADADAAAAACPVEAILLRD